MKVYLVMQDLYLEQDMYWVETITSVMGVFDTLDKAMAEAEILGYEMDDEFEPYRKCLWMSKYSESASHEPSRCYIHEHEVF